MRKLLFCGFLSSGILLLFSSCASQPRSASRAPVTGQPEEGDEVKIGPAGYDRQSRGYEEPWPFGPYSR
jgi:hypothetical protein